MAITLTEEKIISYVKHFGFMLESQLREFFPQIPPLKFHRILYKMWKKNMIKWGGPDDAYVMQKSGSDNVDMLYCDCIWVLFHHADVEEDRLSSYRGKEFLKISYFSREKQSDYNIIYIASEDDYQKISFLNRKYASLIDDDMVNNTRFFFVSENENVLSNIPLEKFAFPHMCVKLDFSKNGRYEKPTFVNITK